MTKNEIKIETFDQIMLSIDNGGDFDEVKAIAFNALLKMHNSKEEDEPQYDDEDHWPSEPDEEEEEEREKINLDDILNGMPTEVDDPPGGSNIIDGSGSPPPSDNMILD
jgi:hypothetical protein